MESASAQVYTGQAKSTRPERRGISRCKVIEEAKAKVPVVDLADRLAVDQGSRWRKVGDEWVTNCVLPDHEDRTPSFAVNREKNAWYCHGCHRGGDVVHLAALAWGIDHMGTAAAEVLLTFEHEIPQRPPSWFAKQERQRPARDRIDAEKIRHLQRRVYRIFLPMIDELADEDERREEARYLWDASGEVAVCIWAGRRAS
jgi:hypothetical protein